MWLLNFCLKNSFTENHALDLLELCNLVVIVYCVMFTDIFGSGLIPYRYLSCSSCLVHSLQKSRMLRHFKSDLHFSYTSIDRVGFQYDVIRSRW